MSRRSDEKATLAPVAELRRRADELVRRSDGSAAEKALVTGGLFLMDRCARLVDSAESLVEFQRSNVKRSREILEMFPPLLGKLGELLDLEIQNARARLEDRLEDRARDRRGRR